MTHSSPTIDQKPHFYGNSAPSSSLDLQQQSPRTRPPVPLFSNSTGSIPQAAMASPNHFVEGGFPMSTDGSQSSVLTSSTDASSATFGVQSNFLDGNFSFDFSSVNDQPSYNGSSVQTVSPKDIMGDTVSAPPSSTFPNLTTPETTSLDSPNAITNSTDTSPLFSNGPSFGGENPDYWPSLFSDIEEPANEAPDTQKVTSPKISPVAPKMSRNDSSPGRSSTRSSNQGRHSFVAGVNPRRRDKPLPDIVVEDPTDTVAMKRARNTLAARKSREKRLQNTEALMAQVTELQAEVEHWKNIALTQGYVE